MLVAGLALVIIAGVGAFAVLRDDGPSYPKAWDTRIQPFVTIVEKQRGLTFDHPVQVRFLAADDFEKTVRTDRNDLSKDDRAEIEQSASLFRAFGLISGDVDLFDAINDASGSGTLAYYSFDDRVITVRGTKLTRASYAVVVHELTHALQDQRFGIAERLERLSKMAQGGAATTQADALQAIVEGDAERVAGLYRQSLGADDQKALQDAETADTADALAELDDVPSVVVSILSAPYALGQALAEAVAADDQDDLDALFERPPPDDSVLLDPLTAIGDIADSAPVEIPSVGTGEKKVDSGQIGALITYLMLAERIPLPDALAAADVWRGDAYVGFERGGVVCARVDYATDAGKGARLGSAFEAWIAAVPGSTATVERDGDRLTFASCDPGTGAELTNDASSDAVQLAATRGFLGAGLVQSGATPQIAGCLSRRLVDEYPVADLNDPEFGGANDPGVTARIQSLAAECARGSAPPRQ